MPLRFLFLCSIWALPIAVGMAIFLLLNSAYIPAPKFTSNVALNEKLERIVERKVPEAEVLALGSSMTLNNLASGPVVDHFGTRSYVNAGAWGMGIKETLGITPALLDHLSPGQVIMVTNLIDFKAGAVVTPKEAIAVQALLKNGSSLWDYFRYWDAPFFLRQMELNRIRFTDPGNYEYLGFDEYGGATLEVPPEQILAARFNAPPPKPEELEESFYEAFASFAALLRSRNVDLIVIQGPYRQGLLNVALKELNAQHATKLREILDASDHRFVDGNAKEWPDSLFNDASHLDRTGAEAFTQWALQQLTD